MPGMKFLTSSCLIVISLRSGVTATTCPTSVYWRTGGACRQLAIAHSTSRIAPALMCLISRGCASLVQC